MAFGRLGRLFRRTWRDDQALVSELDEELAFHLDMRTEELVADGLSPREARCRAEDELGGLGRTRRALLASDRRIERRRHLAEWLREVGGDLRLAGRGLAKSPGFTLAVTLSLALGIGANTAVFSLLDALLLKRLPVAAPDRLVAIGDTSRVGSLSEGPVRSDLLSAPMYRTLRDGNAVFSGLFAAGSPDQLRVGDRSTEPDEPTHGRLVSGNYFSVLGVTAALGRVFTAGDAAGGPGSAPYAVLSYDYWQRRFGGDAAVVGKTLEVNGYPLTVVGVTPRGFFGEVVAHATDLWIPMVMQPQLGNGKNYLDRWDANWLLLMGRLKPGVTLDEARTAMNALFARTIATRAGGAISPGILPQRPEKLRLAVTPGGTGFSYWRKRFSKSLVTLMAIAALVLLIACANVSTLLLERAAGRRRELGVRLALGAGRSRLVRQLLVESLLLAAFGGAVGALFAVWADRGLLALIGLSRSVAFDPRLDLRVLAFTAAVALTTGVLFGIVPALRASRTELAPALEAGGRATFGAGTGGGGAGRNVRAGGASGWTLGKGLVVCQLAVSLLLVAGSGLFLRTLVNLDRLDLGYPRQGLLMLQVDPASAGYTGGRLETLLRELHERIAALPGVRGVTVSENGLFSGTESRTTIALPGRPPLAPEERDVRSDRVGPQYFEVVGIPIVRGRGVGPRDRAGAPRVVVINETMARAFFPGEDPVGRRLVDTDQPDDPYEIVGVSGNAHDHDLEGAVPPRFYTSYLQSSDPLWSYSFEVRTGHPEALVEPVRRAVLGVDPRLVPLDLAPLRDHVDKSLRDERLVARLSTVFGALALLLAAVGLYGVISYATSRRVGEIGVRMALGANGRAVLWMVLRETLVLALTGAALGVPAVLACAHLLSSRLYGLAGHDLPILAGAAALLVVVALVAGALPAARATRIQPTEALRAD
jgi:predicted permease